MAIFGDQSVSMCPTDEIKLGSDVGSHMKTLVIIISLVSLLLGGCSQEGSGATTLPTVSPTSISQLQTIVVALAQAPTSLDPADHRNRPSETVIRNMFDGLVTRDTRSDVHLELAEEIRWLDDQTLGIKLREGVLFHDGVEMTSEDVVFTFQRIIEENAINYPEPHSSPRQALITPLNAIETDGEYGVIMHFSGHWSPVLQMLVHQQIVPKHYIDDVGTRGFIEHPIGTGPFQFVSAGENLREIVLERFDDYYGGAPDLAPVGPACVDRVVFRVVTDTLTRVAALKIGEVDIIQAVPLDLIEDLTENSAVMIKTAPGTRPIWMEMNVNHPLFDDVRVRQALNYLIDKQMIVDEVFNGKAVILSGPLSPFNNFVNEDLNPYPYDPERGKTLLEESGWIDLDVQEPSFVDEFPKSIPEPEEFDLFTIDTLSEWRPVAEAVAEQFRDMDINVSVRVWEREIIIPQLLAGTRVAYLGGWGDSAFDPVGHFEAKWHGYTEGLPYGRGNYSGYNYERLNNLIRSGEVMADSALRQKIYDDAQEILYREAPAVFLILPEEIEGATSRVQNWEPASDGRINLHDVCLGP